MIKIDTPENDEIAKKKEVKEVQKGLFKDKKKTKEIGL